MSDAAWTYLIEDLRARVDDRLTALVASGGTVPERLEASMRHSLLAPGKRVRAALAVIAAEHWGGTSAAALDSACALEMVHAASLVLDDLPAMDDADLRRGRPANHCVYGEGTAILAAIGLMNRAFGVVAEDEALSLDQRVRIVAVLSWSIGTEGLISGQEIDLHGGAGIQTCELVEDMHGRKTGALFAAAAEVGAVVAAAGPQTCAAARRFGWRLGVAFQTFDDLIDRFESRESALKDIGKDAGKPTVVSLVGPQSALAAARGHLAGALAELGPPEAAGALGAMAGALGEGLISRLDLDRLELAHGLS